MKKCRLEKEAHINTRKRERAPREVEERKRTGIFAFAVSFLGFHAAINQPKGMLQILKKFVEKKKQLVNTHSDP
jgi:hypothetical protein